MQMGSLNYMGSSMKETLQPGDELSFFPIAGGEIRPGDVIVFRAPDSGNIVVHRVAAIEGRGIITRGDHNDRNDSWVLQPKDLIGRVVAVKRRGKTRALYGGRRGQAFAVWEHEKKRVIEWTFRVLHPIYHLLVGWGIIQRWLSHLFQVKIHYFQRRNGVEMQLILGRWLIGRRLPGKEQWQINRPFKLLVDLGSLPAPPREGKVGWK